jgi:hypothetical protein
LGKQRKEGKKEGREGEKNQPMKNELIRTGSF